MSVDFLLETLATIVGVANSFTFSYTVLPQPQGDRGSIEEQMETYRQYQRIWAKYA